MNSTIEFAIDISNWAFTHHFIFVLELILPAAAASTVNYTRRRVAHPRHVIYRRATTRYKLDSNQSESTRLEKLFLSVESVPSVFACIAVRREERRLCSEQRVRGRRERAGWKAGQRPVNLPPENWSIALQQFMPPAALKNTGSPCSTARCGLRRDAAEAFLF